MESISWNQGSVNQFVSAHEHGSLSLWDLSREDGGVILQETSTPFGPFPCKAIRKVEWHDQIIIFSGGLPRASYGDKHCVSLYENKSIQVVFDFTSKLIDFFTILDEYTNPLILVVLCEEEVVFIDIQKPDKRCFVIYILSIQEKKFHFFSVNSKLKILFSKILNNFKKIIGFCKFYLVSIYVFFFMFVPKSFSFCYPWLKICDTKPSEMKKLTIQDNQT